MSVSPPLPGSPLPTLDDRLRDWRRIGLMAAAWLAVVVLAGWQTGAWTQRTALADLREQVRAHVELYAHGIRAEIGKFRSVPSVLARSPVLRDALRDPARAATLNRDFAEIVREVGAATLYLLDASGTAVASSNWEQPDSLVGRNFAYRPYYTAAMGGQPGAFFALGTSTNRPGYYLSFPVRSGDGVAGVVVIKVSLEALEVGWASAPEHVVVTNTDDVVVATNVPGWRFHTLAPLSPAARERIRDTLQFAGADLTPLPIRSQWNTEDGGFAVLPAGSGGGTGVVLVEAAPVADTGWTVRAYAPADPVWTQTARAAIVAAALAGLAGWLVLWGVGRSLRLRRRLRQESADRDELERRVRERTAALESTNEMLRLEIGERQRAEAELREAQGDLVQAAKLAALGQMSASLAHELNQPLAAIRTYADNAAVLLDRGRLDDVRGNMREIGALTERMGAISQHLKTFARRSGGERGPVDLRSVLADAIGLLGPGLRARRVDLRQSLPDGPVMVLGEEVRLGQVVVNLVQNACDAIAGLERREVRISVVVAGDVVRLGVADSGVGFAPYQLPRLFQSFFTTKPSGQGLGLGLSISRDIVENFGGRISAGNGEGGGAVVTVELQRAEAP